MHPMSREYDFVNALKNPQGENMQYFAIDLLTEKYDSQNLIRAARENDAVQQLGYLAEITYEAAKKKGLETAPLVEIIRALENAPITEWRYLSPDLPPWGKELISESPQTRQNDKWHIYARLHPNDIAEWIDLYILKEHASPPRR